MTDVEWELECLRKAIGRDRQWHPDLGLSPGLGRMLSLAYKRDFVRPHALAAVYGGDPDNIESVRVGVVRLRQRLPKGVRLVNKKGLYKLEGKEKLRDFIIRI
jgi:hypothetical protein